MKRTIAQHILEVVQAGDAAALHQVEYAFLPSGGIFSEQRSVKVISATPSCLQFHAAVNAGTGTKFVRITCKPTIRTGNTSGWTVTAQVGKKAFSDLQQLMAYALNRTVKINGLNQIVTIDGEETE